MATGLWVRQMTSKRSIARRKKKLAEKELKEARKIMEEAKIIEIIEINFFFKK